MLITDAEADLITKTRVPAAVAVVANQLSLIIRSVQVTSAVGVLAAVESIVVCIPLIEG